MKIRHRILHEKDGETHLVSSEFKKGKLTYVGECFVKEFDDTHFLAGHEAVGECLNFLYDDFTYNKEIKYEYCECCDEEYPRYFITINYKGKPLIESDWYNHDGEGTNYTWKALQTHLESNGIEYIREEYEKIN